MEEKNIIQNESKKANGIAFLIIVIFAVIGVACATLILFKKLKERKLAKDGEYFDDLDDEDDFCDCDCCCCEDTQDEEEAEEAEEKEETAE